MSKTCILTDETAQFLDLSFNGQDRVQLMPIQIVIEGTAPEAVSEMRAVQLPQTRSGASLPLLVAPSVNEFVQVFTNLSRSYSEIVCVLSASGLTGCVANAQKAIEITHGRCKVALVDTGAIGVGLGILVAAAAEMAAAGADMSRIKREILGISEKVYAVFCIQNLAYLEKIMLASPSQALIGEMLDIQQLYYLNGGTLVPVQKIRNSRHMVESILEFVAEFDNPQRVALQQAATGFHQEARTIRERLTLEFPEVQISEMALSLPLAALLGPQSFGLFLWELPE